MADLTKIEEALKRAAYIAIHGTKEQKIGRFMPEDYTPPVTFPVPEEKATRKSANDKVKT